MSEKYLEQQVEPDWEIWARDLDGTGSMHMCTRHCPGAVRYIRDDIAAFHARPHLYRDNGR